MSKDGALQAQKLDQFKLLVENLENPPHPCQKHKPESLLTREVRLSGLLTILQSSVVPWKLKHPGNPAGDVLQHYIDRAVACLYRSGSGQYAGTCPECILEGNSQKQSPYTTK